MKERYLKYIKINQHQYDVTNGQSIIGHLAQDVDGSFYWWPENKDGGCWSSYVMREICDNLDELNAPWEELIRQQVERDKLNGITE